MVGCVICVSVQDGSRFSNNIESAFAATFHGSGDTKNHRNYPLHLYDAIVQP